MHRILPRVFTFLVFVLLIFSVVLAGCGDDDDDNDDADTDDDTGDDDTGDDDTGDDDSQDDDVVPTTLDKTWIPVKTGDTYVLAEGPGEPHQHRNDLLTTPTYLTGRAPRLSVSYFMVITDLHQTDEESPTRLTFFDAATVLDGAFSSAYRPQEDLAPHQLNALVRTANRIQKDYGRDFNFALSLGDFTDNGQTNEAKLFIDILDGNGLTSGQTGWAAPDSGDLNLDPETGLNLGERNFGAQETDGEGNNINQYNRPGYPNSNADIPTSGLRRADGAPLDWYASIGNHDVLSTGTFDPDSLLTFYRGEQFTGDRSPYGYIPGLANTIEYWKQNPNQPLFIGDGLFGLNIDWRIAITTLQMLGQIPDDYSIDLNDRFDLMVLTNNTPGDSGDDGIIIAPDPERAFMRHEGVITLFHENDHGFADHNLDGDVNALDGGYYRLDAQQLFGNSAVPLRMLVLDSAEITVYDEGGLSEDQFSWLEAELEQAQADHVLVILANHHYLGAIPHEAERLRELLHSYANVILHLVGHGHTNQIYPRRAPDEDPLHGYWEVQTASSIEFPQQSRIVEVVDNRDGTGSVFMTMFDHASIENDDSDTLAKLGRELAFNDVLQMGYDGSTFFGGMGTSLDRNVELVFQIANDVVEALAMIPADQPIMSDEVLGTLYP